MARIQHALKNVARLKAVKRKLGIGKDKVYPVRDKDVKIFQVEGKF